MVSLKKDSKIMVSIIHIFLLFIFFICTGCEEMLTQALTQNFHFQESVFNAQNLTGNGGSTPVTVTQKIQPSSEYSQYADNIEEIFDIQLSGSITNNGQSDVQFNLFVAPESGSKSWEGQVAELIIPAGEKILIENCWPGCLDPNGGEERLLGSLNYLIVEMESIVITLSALSDQYIDLEIESVIFSGTLKVNL